MFSAGGQDPAAYLVFPSGQLVPTCVVFPLLFAFFTKGETTDHFLGLWAMFSPTAAFWRNVASKLCVFLRNAFPSARRAVALLPISCEKAERLVWQFLGVSSRAPAEVMHKQCKRVLHMLATAGSLLKVQGLDDRNIPST